MLSRVPISGPSRSTACQVSSPNREGVPRVGSEGHPLAPLQAAVRLSLEEDVADLPMGVVRREAELDGDAFPGGIGVGPEAVPGAVPRQDRYRVEANQPEGVAEPLAERRLETPHERLR